VADHSAIKEHPILFSAPMVRAILEGRKAVTRRVLKPYRKYPIVNLAEAEPMLGYSGQHNDADSWGYEFLDDGAPAPLSACPELCPYGQPGDRLWVRETWWKLLNGQGYSYRADGGLPMGPPGKWKPSIHMPRVASRITLEVTGVRVERLQDITPDQILAEGVQIPTTPEGQALIDISTKHGPSHFLPSLSGNSTDDLLRAHWAALWVAINGIDSWNANPWVWCVSFKRVTS
jgi:hypothetical protein